MGGKLGVLGGMGPQATCLFYQMVIDHTQAKTDQEHIPTLILSDTGMPDRTAALLSGDDGAVKERLVRDAGLLEDWGAAVLAIPCNTSHAFLPYLQSRVSVPIVDMIAETARELKDLGGRRVGVLATDGTVRMGLYHAALKRAGMEAVSPPPEVQALVMEIIYGRVKQGRDPDREQFAAIEGTLRDMGCDRAVLGCTELSVCKRSLGLSEFYLDAMDVLARRCVDKCGYPLREAGSQG